jgi:hypothetical protein
MSPLVLGNAASGNYSTQTYDAVNKRHIITVYNSVGSVVATYTMDAAGHLLINGQPLSAIPEIATILAQAQAAADAAATYANQSGDAAADANESSAAADQALVDANNASAQAAAAAALSQKYAQAPSSETLPSGGVSALVSANNSLLTAQESRYIHRDIAPMVGNETMAATALFRLREVVPVGSAQVVLTIPPNIFATADVKEAWAAYRLGSLTGSLKVVGATAGSGLQAPAIVGSGFAGGYRNQVQPGTGDPFFVDIAVPAVTDGRLVIVTQTAWTTSNPELSMGVTANQGLTLTARKGQTLTAKALVPDFNVYDAPLVAFTAKTVRVTVDPGVNGSVITVQWFALEGTTADAPVCTMSPLQPLQPWVEMTLTAVPARTRVLACAAMRGGETATAFSSWGSTIIPIASHNTSGLENTAVSDTNATKNMSLARASIATSVAGDLVVRANFTQAFDEPAMMLITYPPKTVAGSDAVILQLMGGRDTLSVPYGEMVLQFRRDGRTVIVSTPAS